MTSRKAGIPARAPLQADLWAEVLSNLDQEEREKCRAVCRLFRQVVDDSTSSFTVDRRWAAQLELQPGSPGLFVFSTAEAFLRWEQMFRYLARLPKLTQLALEDALPLHCLSEVASLPHLEQLQLEMGPSSRSDSFAMLNAAPLCRMKLTSFICRGGPLLGPFVLPCCTSLLLTQAWDFRPCINTFTTLCQLQLLDDNFRSGQGQQASSAL